MASQQGSPCELGLTGCACGCYALSLFRGHTADPEQCLCGTECSTAWHHTPQTHSLPALSPSPAQHGCPCEERKPGSVCGLPPVQANAVLQAGGWLGRWGGDSDRSQTFLCRVSWALPTSPSPPGCGGVPWLRHFPAD